jgi:hypothetical protein
MTPQPDLATALAAYEAAVQQFYEWHVEENALSYYSAALIAAQQERIRELEEAGAEVEMRLQENSELLSAALNRATLTGGYDDAAKRKISEAWKWAYYASAIHLQVIVGTEARNAYRAKVAKVRADSEAWFAQQAATAQADGSEGATE